MYSILCEIREVSYLVLCIMKLRIYGSSYFWFIVFQLEGQKTHSLHPIFTHISYFHFSSLCFPQTQHSLLAHKTSLWAVEFASHENISDNVVCIACFPHRRRRYSVRTFLYDNILIIFKVESDSLLPWPYAHEGAVQIYWNKRGGDRTRWRGNC